MAAGNTVSIFAEGMFMAFTVGSDGTLCQRVGNPPEGFVYVTPAGVFDPDSALSIGRIVYDPANAFYRAFWVAGKSYKDSALPVIALYDPTNGWRIYNNPRP